MERYLLFDEQILMRAELLFACLSPLYNDEAILEALEPAVVETIIQFNLRPHKQKMSRIHQVLGKLPGDAWRR